MKNKEKIEYFTDEMAKNIYPFQPPYQKPKGGKPISQTISIKPRKK
jgi:hypothetical protein